MIMYCLYNIFICNLTSKRLDFSQLILNSAITIKKLKFYLVFLIIIFRLNMNYLIKILAYYAARFDISHFIYSDVTKIVIALITKRTT